MPAAAWRIAVCLFRLQEMDLLDGQRRRFLTAQSWITKHWLAILLGILFTSLLSYYVAVEESTSRLHAKVFFNLKTSAGGAESDPCAGYHSDAEPQRPATKELVLVTGGAGAVPPLPRQGGCRRRWIRIC